MKSFSYFKSIFGGNIDLGELKELSDWIMGEMRDELEIENEIHRNYIVTDYALNILKTSG